MSITGIHILAINVGKSTEIHLIFLYYLLNVRSLETSMVSIPF